MTEAPMVKWSEEFWDEFVWIREGGRTIEECARALDTTVLQIAKYIPHAPRAARKAYDPQLLEAHDRLDRKVANREPFTAESLGYLSSLDPRILTTVVASASNRGRVRRTGRMVKVLATKELRTEWVAA
jgi:hypothetical protein